MVRAGFSERKKGLRVNKRMRGKMMKLYKTAKGSENRKGKGISKGGYGSGANIVLEVGRPLKRSSSAT